MPDRLPVTDYLARVRAATPPAPAPLANARAALRAQPHHVDWRALLPLTGEAFLRAAYASCLLREPSRDELRAVSMPLATPADRLEYLSLLVRSAEAQHNNLRATGLSTAYHCCCRVALLRPLAAWLAR